MGEQIRKTTKFSDFNAYHQFIQTRAAATLTTAALATAIVSVCQKVLPEQRDDYDWILYIVIRTLPWLVAFFLLGR